MLEPAFAHEADPVGQRKGFLLVVGNDERSHPQGLEQCPQFADESFAQRDVEAREGFVEQQDGGTRREGARDGHALLLASRELGGVRLGAVVEAHELQGLHRPGTSLRAGQ